MNVEGIYVSYLTGAAGNGVALLCFRNGMIVGADMSGLVFSGEYQVNEARILGKIRFTMPPFSTSIAGAATGYEPMAVDVPIELSLPIKEEDIFLIKTPVGQINARLKMLTAI